MGSTVPEMKVEICSNCHPLYTGEKRYIDTAGRLDRFKARMEKSQKIRADLAKSKEKKQPKEETKGEKAELQDKKKSEK